MANVRRTSLNLNLELVEEAKKELGTRGTTDTVHRALEEVVRRAKIERMLAIRFDHLPDDWHQQIEEEQWGA